MGIQIYNTLSRKKENFVPIKPNEVSMYLCGPTVYNYIHIGNARSTVAFDTVRRYFEFRGYKVNYVSNFTDVDDKIIKTANQEGISTKELADKYIEAFKEDTGKLNVQPACLHPRVVDHIDDIIDFVSVLIDKGYAYESQGDVYYRTRLFKPYGKLSNKSIDELEIGASQRTGDESAKKEDPLDFALWKEAKEHEVSWDSPWGKGRPGWHIECSVMATKHLGDTIDIHAGGQDLEFPHHENEIAQSEAKTDQTFAHYWMHNAYLTVGESGEKMSKSLGNFITAHDLMKDVSPEVVRFALSTTHYRRPMPFNETTIKEATTNLGRIKSSYNNASFRLETSVDSLENDHDWLKELSTLMMEFVTEMDDDFNAANGITVVYQLVKHLNRYLEEETVSKEVISAYQETLEKLVLIFGIELASSEDLLDEDIDALISERNTARKEKNFARSDEIRDLLKEQGIILEDTPQGTRWSRSE
ncbi:MULTISPECIES: cysteine--tRNA ligase [Enterococcaceae]|uniref:cysteine--tRNA ligase n=1 Tax=Enterococcaceae TaxID=81852 RepID=UPI000E47E31F|nr:MULTISPECIES: cysteine--tRNA ligase [Enterococcaceae]MCI0130942.1 cysteine--tRNA ligase [Vagococcus sp. CY53-2]RGI30318.1 cysteine--tRNA ligase [Melissococcus sp. OM08-11BH]UNM89327.1 cysteine--tRNA ligase [Vagococcus sp. CY52-2]